MLKTTDKSDQSAHFSYNEYKKKVHKAPNRDLTIFVAVFFVGVIILLGFAKLLSPNVDVAIAGSENNVVEEVERSAIDERLRAIKMEDEGKNLTEEGMFSPELDERVILPQQNNKTVGQIEAEKAEKELIDRISSKDYFKKSDNVVQKIEQVTNQATQSIEDQAVKTVAPQDAISAKVVVGYYSTDKQAEVAKTIIQDAGLGLTPFIRDMGGYYTLQVGSYSSRENAQRAANDLLKSNFPARVIVE
ncbi:MAG: SPOR domain-containing protein [Cyanobacteria bacterium SIG26]|nr:SPOR domain-containing protein [Cyanobacteria bacterium SIG26]